MKRESKLIIFKASLRTKFSPSSEEHFIILIIWSNHGYMIHFFVYFIDHVKIALQSNHE